MDELSLRRDSSFGKSKKDSPLGGGLEAIATCLMTEVGRLRRVGVKKMSIDGSCWVVGRRGRRKKTREQGVY